MPSTPKVFQLPLFRLIWAQLCHAVPYFLCGGGPLGRRRKKKKKRSGIHNRIRVYDDTGQTREIRDFWAESRRLIALQRFDYNGAGEVKSRLGVPFDYGKAPGSFSAIYDAENRLFSANGVVTSHDDDGNLLFAADPLYGGTMALSYNSRNQLLSAAVGGVSGSFTYDAEGHRQSATHAGQTSTFTVNPAAELSQVLVRQVEGGQRTWAVYGLGLLYEVEIESVSEPVYTLVGGDIMTLVSQVTERLRVHHYDQTGNTVAISDGQGRDVLWVQYDAYGAVVHAESPTQADGGAPVRPEVNALPDGLQRALAVTPWLYVGEHGVMTDPTGLLHMRARYYHPGLTRFLNADPIQFEGGMNWYGYAIGDPVLNIDPLGLDAWTRSMGALRMVGGGFEAVAGYSLATAAGVFGAGSSWSGVGLVVGGAGVVGGAAIGAHGIDTFQAGFRQMRSGSHVESGTSVALQSAGMSPRAANLTDAGISVVGSLGAGFAATGFRAATLSTTAAPAVASASMLTKIKFYEAGQTSFPKVVYDANYVHLTNTLDRGAKILADHGGSLWNVMISGSKTLGIAEGTIRYLPTPLANGAVGSIFGGIGGVGCRR